MNQKTMLDQAKELLKAAKENPEQFQDLSKKYMGFKAVEAKAKESGAKDPGAVAAAIGRKKYGKEAFQHAAATGHKMGKGEKEMDRTAENQRKADLRDKKIRKEESKAGEPVGGQISSESPSTQGIGTLDKEENCEGEPVGGQISSENMKKDGIAMAKDDMPHPPGSPKAQAHNVAEGDQSLHHALKILDTPEKQKKMLHHLRTIHEPSDMRSPQNRVAGGVPPKAPIMQKTSDDMPGTSEAGIGPAATGALASTEKSEVIKMAQQLIKAAKENPGQFEELVKLSSVAGLSVSEKDPTKKTSTIGLGLAASEKMGKDEKSAAKPMAASRIESTLGPSARGGDPNKAAAPMNAAKIDPSSKSSARGGDPSKATHPMKDPSPFKDNSRPAPNPNPSKDPSPFKDNSRPAPNPAPGKDPSPFKDNSRPAPNPNPMPASKILGKGAMRMTKDEIKEDMKKEWKPKHLKRCM